MLKLQETFQFISTELRNLELDQHFKLLQRGNPDIARAKFDQTQPSLDVLFLKPAENSLQCNEEERWWRWSVTGEIRLQQNTYAELEQIYLVAEDLRKLCSMVRARLQEILAWGHIYSHIHATADCLKKAGEWWLRARSSTLKTSGAFFGSFFSNFTQFSLIRKHYVVPCMLILRIYSMKIASYSSSNSCWSGWSWKKNLN